MINTILSKKNTYKLYVEIKKMYSLLFQNSVAENENICNTQQNYVNISTIT